MASLSSDERFVEYKEDNFFSETFTMLNTMRHEKRLCDVTIKVGSTSVTAHRNILAATIPYFQEMFLGSSSESANISMENVDAESVEQLVDYAYTGVVRIDEQNVHALMVAAHVLQLQSVHAECIAFMLMRQLVIVRELSTPVDPTALATASEKCIRGLSQTVRKMLTLGGQSSIASEGTLNSRNDEIWLFGTTGSVHSFDPNTKTLRTHRASGFSDNYQHIAVYDSKFYSFGERNDRVDMFDPATDEWTTWSPQNVQNLSNLCMPKPNVLVNGNFGLANYNYFYCADTDTWSVMNCRRTTTSVRCDTFVFENCMYKIGQDKQSKWIVASFAINSVNPSWIKTANFEFDITNYGVAGLNGKLYICGGISKSLYCITQSARALDIKTRTWIEIAPMISPRYDMALVAHMGLLWAIGGYESRNSFMEPNLSIEVYHPDSNAWQLSATIPFGGQLRGLLLK